MSPRAEKVLVALLPDTESLVILTREGLPEECVPSEELRDVLVWAKEYYGRTRRAPSVEMVKERYGDLLSDHEIDIDDEPDETMEWVIDSLKANRVKAEVARHAKDLVRGVREAPPEHKVEALAEHVSRLSALSIDLLPSYQQADLRDSIIEVLDRHDERAAEGHVIRGLRFGLPEVDEYYGGVHPGEVAVVAAPAKMGKAMELTTPVLTPSGWSTIGDLQVGDEVIGRDGRPTRVIQLHPVVDLPTYRLTTADGGTTVCSEQHLWTIQTRDQRTTGTSMTIETTELAQRVGRGQTVYLPMVDPVQHPEADLPVHPYILGVLIGDGALTSGMARVTKQDVDLHEKVAALHGQEVVYYEDKRGKLARTSVLHGLMPTVRDLGLDVISLHKFIPEDYLTASVEQRSDLLRGLMDSDGERLISPSGGGTTRYCTSSHRLAKDVQALVWSLGGMATIRSKVTTHAEHYRVNIRMPQGFGCPFTTARKVALWEASQATDRAAREPSRRIASVEPAGVRRVRCITVENEDGLYVTEDYIVTHNSFFMTWCAYKNWEAGVPVGIFPLENGREMTEMRIACQATGIDYNDLDRGLLSSQDMDTLVAWVNDVLLESDTPLMIFEPDVATPHAMLQQAHAYDLDGVILDQLTFIQPTKVRRDAAPREVIQQNMRDLHNLAARGRKKLPIIMAHQINREGIKNAARTGWLTMTDMAESSEVERASDFVFGLYGSDDMIRSGMIQLQSLASRRVQGRSYDLNWHPAIGGISVHEQIELPTDFR